MDEKRKLALTIAGGFVILLFMHNNFYRPGLKENIQRYKEYKALREDVKTLEKFSEEMITLQRERIKEVSNDLDKRLPSVEERVDMIEQLTNVSKDLNIAFVEINRRAPLEKEGYRVSSIDMAMKATLLDFLRYLEEIDKGPLLVLLDKIDMRKGQGVSEPNLLDIGVTLSGYQITKEPSLPPTYLQDKLILPLERIDKLLEPVIIQRKTLDLSGLKTTDLFGARPTPRALPQEILDKTPSPLEAKPLKLKGITQIGKRKVALINNKVVKVGDQIEGMEVIEISRFSVVLSKGQERYILKLGKER